MEWLRFVLKLEVEIPGGKPLHILSDASWKLSLAGPAGWEKPEFDDSSWNAKLKTFGPFGIGPWGIAGLNGPGGGSSPAKNPLDVDNITVAEGFKVEMLYEVPKSEQGSWVSLTTDDKGRLLASDQGGAGLYRVTITEHPEKPQVEVEKMPVAVSGAQGMTWHNDALYFNRSGGPFYKVTDSNGDGALDYSEELPGAKRRRRAWKSRRDCG